MPAGIAQACQHTGQPRPPGPAATVRRILDSLALAYRRVISQVQELSGRHVDVVHLAGGGTRNTLLCQLTAGACGRPVIAGPAAAAARGNVLVQARSPGAVPADLDGMRALLRGTQACGATSRPPMAPAAGRSPRAGSAGLGQRRTPADLGLLSRNLVLLLG